VQELVFENDGNLAFRLGDPPVSAWAKGGRAREGTSRGERAAGFSSDRRGQLDTMEPRAERRIYVRETSGHAGRPVRRGCSLSAGVFVTFAQGSTGPRNSCDVGRRAVVERSAERETRPQGGKGLPPLGSIVAGVRLSC